MSDGNLCCFSDFDNNDGGDDAKGTNTMHDNRSPHGLSAYGLMGNFPECSTSMISFKPYSQLTK